MKKNIIKRFLAATMVTTMMIIGSMTAFAATAQDITSKNTINYTAFGNEAQTAIIEGWKQDSIGYKYLYSNGSYLTNGWLPVDGKWYYFNSDGYMETSKWIGESYVGSDGAMLTNTTTPDGHQVDSNGYWIPPGGRGMRVWMEDAHIGIGSHEEGLPLYNRETRLGVENVVILDSRANMVIFVRELGGNIEPSNHTIRIVGLKEYGNGQLVELTKDGEPVSYPFEYNKSYNLDFTGTHSTAESLSKYCRENNILILIWVEDDRQEGSIANWKGQYFAYANDSSVPNGQIGQ